MRAVLSKCVMAVGAIALVAAISAQSRAELVGYYGLNETVNPSGGTTAVDSSIYGHDGTYLPTGSNGPTVGVASANASLYGTAASFDGSDDKIDIGTYCGGLTSSFTIAAWIKPTSVSNYLGIISDAGANADKGWCLALTAGGNIRLTTLDRDDLNSTATVSAGQWSHVAVVFDSSNAASFYLNGVFVDKVSSFSSAKASTNPYYIGAGPGGGHLFSGAIDEVRIYSSALNGDQIAGLATIPEPGSLVLVVTSLLGLVCYAWQKRK
jgi:hypothetical protein